MDQFLDDAAASIASFRVDYDVISLAGKGDLEANAHVADDGHIRVTVRKSTSLRSEAAAAVSHSHSQSLSMLMQMLQPRVSNLSGVEIEINLELRSAEAPTLGQGGDTTAHREVGRQARAGKARRRRGGLQRGGAASSRAAARRAPGRRRGGLQRGGAASSRAAARPSSGGRAPGRRRVGSPGVGRGVSREKKKKGERNCLPFLKGNRIRIKGIEKKI